MIKVQANCSSKMTEEQMQSIRGMGIEYLAVNFLMEDATYDGIMKFKEKAARCHLTISDAGCPNLQKCPDIHLGKPTRDLWIERYNEFTRALGKAGIPVNYLAWQPNGIFRTRMKFCPVRFPMTENTVRKKSGTILNISWIVHFLYAKKPVSNSLFILMILLFLPLEVFIA